MSFLLHPLCDCSHLQQHTYIDVHDSDQGRATVDFWLATNFPLGHLEMSRVARSIT